MHPADRIRGSWSSHLAGRRIILGVAGSIAAVRTVELARMLIRHGAEVRAVMTPAAMGIITPDALEFATGQPVVTRLSGQVEHVTWLGEDGDADLLVIAPATANTVAKMSLGIDDTPVTTCAQVALGAGRSVLVAPAMHGVMEENPATRTHMETLKALGVRFVAALYEEGKAKLAMEAVVQAVLQELGPGTLRGKRALVVTGRSEEPIDTVRVLSNRASGRTGHALAAALHRHGAELTVFTSSDPHIWPPETNVEEYTTLDSLIRLASSHLAAEPPDWIFVPAALADFVPAAAGRKIKSGSKPPDLRLVAAQKLLPVLREHAPDARIVAWKLEDALEDAVQAARSRLAEYGIDAVMANAAAALGSNETQATLVLQGEALPLAGRKSEVMESMIAALAARFHGEAAPPRPRSDAHRTPEAAP